MKQQKQTEKVTVNGREYILNAIHPLDGVMWASRLTAHMVDTGVWKPGDTINNMEDSKLGKVGAEISKFLRMPKKDFYEFESDFLGCVTYPTESFGARPLMDETGHLAREDAEYNDIFQLAFRSFWFNADLFFPFLKDLLSRAGTNMAKNTPPSDSSTSQSSTDTGSNENSGTEPTPSSTS